jgi:SSS family solute:Na+ symporter
MNPLDILVLVLYFGGVCAAGLWFAKRNTSTEAYFLGNRNFPAWAIGISMVGTSISSISFLAYPGDAYKTAWLRMLPNFMLPFAILVAAIWILPIFRAKAYTSAFEYLEDRFGPSTRIYGAVMFIIAQLVRVSMILFLVSLLIQQFTGWNIAVCIFAGGIIVAFYTVVGGFEAVVWTDVIQTIVLLLGGIICLAIILNELPGGIGQVMDSARDAGKFAFAPYDSELQRAGSAEWTFSFTKQTALMMLLVGLVSWMTEYSSNQNVVQRYCASRSIANARKSMWLCCVTSIPIWAFFMFVGTALYAYYQAFPTPETTGMLMGTDDFKSDQILPFFILQKLPAGLAGLVVAAVLAAAMSSLDSSINAISTVTITDIVKRHLKPGLEDKQYLRMAHWIAIASSVVMIIGAMVFSRGQDTTMQDTVTKMVAITAGGLMGLYFLGFFTRRGDGRSIGIGIACTIAFTTYRALEELEIVPKTILDSYYTGIVGNILILVTGLIAFYVFRSSKDRDLTNMTVWTMRDDPDTIEQ